MADKPVNNRISIIREKQLGEPLALRRPSVISGIARPKRQKIPLQLTTSVVIGLRAITARTSKTTTEERRNTVEDKGFIA